MRAIIGENMAARTYSEKAAAIVRSCVHCGFCNATCPTYQLTGDELEGPRGRIYLIKSFLEDGVVGEQTQTHLDQCLLCRNCETTCPSGVQYGSLLELVRPQVDVAVGLSWSARLTRALLVNIVPHRRRFAALVRLGQFVRPLLPPKLALTVPRKIRAAASPTAAHARKILVLGGCAQPVLNPNIDAAAARVFDRVGVSLVTPPNSGCCGALAGHLGYEHIAVEQAKANVDAWWPAVEAGAEAVIATSSGCGVQLKNYARILADEPDYLERARHIQALVRDPIELLSADALRAHVREIHDAAIAFQAPCTLQHGLQLAGRVEHLLARLGWSLVTVNEAHLCCGSAGSYSILHRQTAQSLRRRKLDNLLRGDPAMIVTANIGCQSHLSPVAGVPVRHWLELLADNLK